MNEEALKLTVYFGERQRVDGRFLADALSAVYERHRLAVSLVMRGAEGFGAKHGLRTDRLLTLSEDLPLVSVAVDARPRIEAALADVDRLPVEGLVTLERARLLAGDLRCGPPPAGPGGATKLTVYLGRHERVGRSPAHQAVVRVLEERGVAGATVLLGVDGTAHGVRRRARFLGRNAQVPVMVIAVGDGDRIAACLPELHAMLVRPLATLERVQVCKRDGRRLAAPHPPSGGDAARQKLTVYAGEQSRHAGRPLAGELVRALRGAGAAGATSLRGIWGYHGDHPPRGDALWQLRRRVPVVTVLVDTPERIHRWFAVVDELTDETGLVTSEVVPWMRGGRGG